MKASWIGIFLACFFLVAWADAQDEEKLLLWKERAVSRIESLEPESPIEDFVGISGYLRLTSRGESMMAPHREVLELVQKKIMSIAAFDEKYRTLIEEGLKDEYEELNGKGRSLEIPRRWDMFSCLENLPSPRVVALLGDFLDDDRDPRELDKNHSYQSLRPNSQFAVQTLCRIGIEGVPVVENPLKRPEEFESIRHQWRLWFGQVRAGNRTFRFKGDPVEYNLEGPVAAKVAVHSRLRVTRTAGPEPVTETAVPSKSWWPLAVALGLLGAGVWRALRFRKTEG